MSVIVTSLPESGQTAVHQLSPFSGRMCEKPGLNHDCATNR